MSRKKKKGDPRAESTPSPYDLAALETLKNLPPGKEESPSVIPVKTSKRGKKNTNRGRVDIIRQTAHRGGKAVTIAKNFKGINATEIQDLAKLMRRSCGVGGSVKNGSIEIQGDKREEVKRILLEAGFNPVFSGG